MMPVEFEVITFDINLTGIDFLSHSIESHPYKIKKSPLLKFLA